MIAYISVAGWTNISYYRWTHNSKNLYTYMATCCVYIKSWNHSSRWLTNAITCQCSSTDNWSYSTRSFTSGFLQAIRLADSIPVQPDLASIDILLGSDYFCNIIERERIVLPSGLLLFSKLGYILTGRYLDPTKGDIDDNTCLVMSHHV